MRENWRIVIYSDREMKFNALVINLSFSLNIKKNKDYAHNIRKATEKLKSSPRTWLITGVAGFIGSNLLETLLKLEQKVVGLDNFSTGFQHNLDEVQISGKRSAMAAVYLYQR